MKKGIFGKLILFLTAALILTGFSAFAAVPAEGVYTLFGMKNEGYTVKTEDVDARSVLTLTADGKGNMIMDDDAMGVTEWAPVEKSAEMMDGGAADQVIHLVLDDGSTCDCAVRNGILEMDVMGNGEMLLLYAKEGADYSAYPLLTMEELMAKMEEDQYKVPESNTRLYALWKTMDPAAGIHLSYEKKLPALNAVQSYEVYGKGSRYYSQETSTLWGYTNTKVTYASDGKVYSLDPGTKTAELITEIYMDSVKNRVILMDSLYQAMFKRLRDSVSTEGTKAINGVTYAAEIYPASEYEPEAVFCFAADGTLAYYLESAPSFAPELGESIYTIRAIDGQVDESLLNPAGYQVK